MQCSACSVVIGPSCWWRGARGAWGTVRRGGWNVGVYYGGRRRGLRGGGKLKWAMEGVCGERGGGGGRRGRGRGRWKGTLDVMLAYGTYRLSVTPEVRFFLFTTLTA